MNKWKSENKHSNFINYNALEDFENFGGIRIEDNILITDEGYRMLGPHIPKTVDDIESLMQS